MIDTTHLKAHCTAASLRQEGAAPGRSLVLLLTEGQMNDHKGAALILPALPAKDLIADRGYDSNRFRTALVKREFTP